MKRLSIASELFIKVIHFIQDLGNDIDMFSVGGDGTLLRCLN